MDEQQERRRGFGRRLGWYLGGVAIGFAMLGMFQVLRQCSPGGGGGLGPEGPDAGATRDAAGADASGDAGAGE